MESAKNLFRIIYKHTPNGNDQKEHFKNALKKLDNINSIITEQNNDKSDKEIFREIKENYDKIQEEIKNYFNKKNSDDELSLSVHFESYEKDIKSIFYFFDNLPNDENWNKILNKKYRNISKSNIKEYLDELKKNDIYDYVIESKSPKSNYIQFFNCLYQKQEAIDYLIQEHDNLNLYYENLDPIKGTLVAKDIEDTINCVEFFNKIKKYKNNEEAFKYIKESFKNNDKLIESFKNFSYIYPRIIELDQNFDNFSLSLYNIVKKILKKLYVIMKMTNDEIYIENQIDEKEKIHTINDLFTLKNKINVKSKNSGNISQVEKKIKKKTDTLLIFKEIINNIESIYEQILILRIKGNILPIRIKIEIIDLEKDKNEENVNIEVKYFINDKNGKEVKKSLNYIEKFLINAKNDFIRQLEEFYKMNDFMRFFYGKQIVTIVNHLDGYRDIFPFLRFILNNTDDEEIKTGDVSNQHAFNDFIRDYEDFQNETFKNISDYVVTLFKNNNSSLEEHYNKMKIRYENNEEKLAGIYIFNSNNESMEDDILQIFLDKVKGLPKAQNILITNKETSYEEMQVFLNRAILCKYNTLFIIEINESFSETQQRYLNRFVDKLLAVKSENKKNSIKGKPSTYMDSCLVFVCNEKSKASLNYIEKTFNTDSLEIKNHSLETTQIKNNSLNDNINNSANLNSSLIKNINYSREILNKSRDELNANIHIIKSEICGLGKTEKIKKEIKENGKKYIHFPIGGNISRDLLYEKLNKILKKIDEIKKKENKKIAIHLDLYDNDSDNADTSILNEFLFSVLITKFYSNTENIVYLPKEIEIYVEVPNCFEDFISRYKILSAFNIKNIELDNKPELNLSEDKLLHFKNMLGLHSNQEIEKEINKFFDIKKHSYHQLNIFINLFIGQYSKTKNKRKFYIGWSNVTDKVITSFKNCTQYFTSGPFSNLLLNKDLINKTKEKDYDYKSILESTYTNDIEGQAYEYPLIFRNPKEKGTSYYHILSIRKDYIGFTDFEGTKEDEYNYKYDSDNSLYFLSILKEILELETPIERLKKIIDDDAYVITDDNFRKMVLIIYRIVANIPVILMGETGCGKTSLIKILNQLLNNGEEKLEFINIHPGIYEDEIKAKMEKINEKAKNVNEFIWVFFDELNTCNSFTLLTEIFINRSFEGEKLSDNIRLIGACNPYRIREKGKLKCGLSHPDDFDINKKDYVYTVNMLPQSLMYYIFNFGAINKDDEKKYIKRIISKCFANYELELKNVTSDIISFCHEFLRKRFDPSVVSLREISRFSEILKFMIDYYKNKIEYYRMIETDKYQTESDNKNNEIFKKLIENRNEDIEKLKAIIVSIYICYYIRLTEIGDRIKFDNDIKDDLLKLINGDNYKEIEGNANDLFNFILNKDFKEDLELNGKIQFNKFNELLELEEEFILDKIQLDKGIGNSRSLRENLFLLFVSLGTLIPLIIIGKPGSGKSLSSHLIYKSMKGKYSQNKFFQLYPNIIQSYFQGSKSATPEDIINIFNIAENKLNSFKLKKNSTVPISMLLFDELGLAEKSIYNPLKVLHSKLDEYFNEHKKMEDNNDNQHKVAFVGITNWNLDAAKLNRALSLSVPDLEENMDDLRETSTTIAKSFNSTLADKKNIKNLTDIDENDSNQFNIFEDVLPKIYFEYKKSLKNFKKLMARKEYIETKKKDLSLAEIEKETEFKALLIKEKKIKVDFHGNRDFFYLIKGIAREINETNETEDIKYKVELIEKYIERNFGGMDIDIEIDISEVEKNINEKDRKYLINIINLKKNKVTSVEYFKSIYNTFIDEKSRKNEKLINYKINVDNIRKYNIIKCIYDNVSDINSRYLLLGIESSLAILINQNIDKKMQNLNKKVYLITGSSFINDQKMEYQYRVLNDIQEHAKDEKGHILLLQNLNSIYPFLYDLFNMNYLIKDGKSYARICHGNYSDQLALIDKAFRIAIIVDKNFIGEMESPLLNRFEKIIFQFNELLSIHQQKITENLLENELNFESKITKIKNKNKLNYNIKNLFIGCKNEDIQGLVYDFSKDLEKIGNDDEKNIKSKVIKKLVKMLPQDIIVNLDNNDLIRIEYFKNKKYYNINEYIQKKDKDYKISIIYTFNNITDNIQALDPYGESILISDIKSEKELKKKIINTINDYKKLDKKKYYIFLRFVQSNSNNLNFVINFLKNNFQEEQIYFICIIHIKRNFNIKDKKNIDKKEQFEDIYSIPNLYSIVEQLFIDNLNSLSQYNETDNKTLNLKEILENSVLSLIEYINLEKEFERAVRSFINKYLINNNRLLKGENEFINQENYLTKLVEFFFDKDLDLKDSIIEKAKQYINMNGEQLITEIYNNGSINKNSLDIISIIIDYIRENLIYKYIIDILENLEDNNFITSLLVLNCKNEKEQIDCEIITKIKNIEMEGLKYKNKNYNVKFDLNYVLPGFYNIVREISNIISENYSDNLKQNEKKLREFLKGDKEVATSNFFNNESALIEQLYIELQSDKNVKIFKMIDLIIKTDNLFFRDYITFYLDKYYYNNDLDMMHESNHYINYLDEVYYKILNLLLEIRFKEDKNDINEVNSNEEDNNEDSFKLILKKICWLESNSNYIIGILEIYKKSKEILHKSNEKQDDEKLFEIVSSNIKNLNLKYITNEEKNPDITTTVNECYYLVLASIIYSITYPNINFNTMKSLQLTNYIDTLKDISKILEELNNNLFIFLNEMYIIDEFILIYEAFKNIDNKNLLNTFSETLRENSLIIQKNEKNISDELIQNFQKLYELITQNLTDKDESYFILLKNIIFKEIKKLKDVDYRTSIFNNLVKENEIIKDSCNIFQILLRDLVKPSKINFAKTIKNLLDSQTEIIQIIENIITNESVVGFDP